MDIRVRRLIKKYLVLVVFVAVAGKGFTQITMPRFFADHMVLKSEGETLFWGWCKPGRTVSIKPSWLTDTLKTVAAGTSKWKVALPTTKAGGPYNIIIISEKDTLKINDVLMGEVWICSGQSNMQRSANEKLPQMLEALNGPFNENIRILNVKDIASPWPQENIYDTWSLCDSRSLFPFTAIGYFFAQKLNKELNTPIGIINASWGGTCAEVWLPAGEVLSDSLLTQKSRLQPVAPRKPNLPGEAWNSMIFPFVGYSLSGALWYQGENNTVSWDGYSVLFAKLIQSWRRSWKADLPFFFAQIAPYNYKNKGIQKGALVREAQSQVALSVEKTGMVLTSDLVNDVNDIHPLMKKEVAMRMADLALADVYHRLTGNVQSPVYKDYAIEKDKVIISFHHMEHEKLQVKGGGRINDLYIAGADQKFLPADYKLDGNRLIVFNREIKQPVSVRYAFSDTTITNLYSTNGLPVSLFRLDKWNIPTNN
jgi:sialate O-acetylesterase